MKKDVDARDKPGHDELVRSLPRSFDTPLPIDAVLDELGRTLTDHNAAVLVAPPGAGKTTRVPLALLDAPWLNGKKIIMLEPRRIAARAHAARMGRPLCGTAGENRGDRGPERAKK
jgi:ATP-dependent helicase HrpB